MKGSGDFEVKGGRLYSQDGAGRKFRWTVVPDEKREPDPAVLWTHQKIRDKVEDYQAVVEVVNLEKSRPRLDIILEGSGKNVITSGMAIMLSSNRNGMDWRVAHYDTVYFEGRAEHVESADIHVLRFSKCGNRYSLYCNDEPVFENLTLPAVKPGLIGFAFKKENTALERFELAKLHLK